MTDNDRMILASSANPVYAERDLHDFPYGHGGRPCPFGFEHGSTPIPAACESGWTGDRCSLPLGHDSWHSNDIPGREAYLSCADELDPWGVIAELTATTLDDLDPAYVASARAFAELHHLPFPVRSVDHALDLVERAEGNDR